MKLMKQFVLICVALFALSACNKDLGPEYETPPTFDKVMFTPMTPTADDDVTVRVNIQSQYGISAVWIIYALNDDHQHLKQTNPKAYAGVNEKQVQYVGENILPKQPKGTKVTFQVLCATPYGVVDGSKLAEYTVGDKGELKPVDPSKPEA